MPQECWCLFSMYAEWTKVDENSSVFTLRSAKLIHLNRVSFVVLQFLSDRFIFALSHAAAASLASKQCVFH